MAALIFIVRAALGVLLIIAGVLKAHDGPAVTASTIAGYRLLPPFAVAPLGLFLPYFEIGLGAYLVAGLFTRTAALVAAAQFVVFAIAVASLVVRHIPASCGCFGAGDNLPPSWGHVGADLLLAALAGLVAAKAPGLFSVDGILRGKSGNDEARESTEPLVS